MESLSWLFLEKSILNFFFHLSLRISNLEVLSDWLVTLLLKLGNDIKFQLSQCFIYIDYLIFDDFLLTKIFRVILIV